MGVLDRVRSSAERLEAYADRRLPRPDSFPPAARSTALTARVGRLLAITFGVCFGTGLISHFVQHPWSGPGLWPPGPAGLYRVTQGLHVTSGVASLPLLAVKLWSVAPKFWQRPLFGGLVHALERMSILILIASAGFQLITGLSNVAEFYAWSFFFPRVHFAVAFVSVGSIIVHIAVKLPVIRTALGEPVDPVDEPRPGLSRRGVLGLAGAGAGLAVITTVGDKINPLSPVSVFAQRTGAGPQGLPVNQTAAATGVTPKATDATWTLEVVGRARTVRLTRDQLIALPQRDATLPIACVEGWSVSAQWQGVAVRDLLALVDEAPTSVRLTSLERSLYGTSTVSSQLAAHPDTLVALRLNGEQLDLDHGYPARLIAPNRPGAMQTKWLERIEVIR